jgi:hypothetical protein
MSTLPFPLSFTVSNRRTIACTVKQLAGSAAATQRRSTVSFVRERSSIVVIVSCDLCTLGAYDGCQLHSV